MDATKEKESKALNKTQQSKEAKTHPERAFMPLDEMDRMFERWFEHAFPRSWLKPLHTDWHTISDITRPVEIRSPKMDVIDRGNELRVRAELPGIDKDDVDVSISENSVTIKGETKHENKEEKEDFYRCEISRGSFARTISLPYFVNTEKAKASFKNGVLELTLPKTDKAKRRSVKID